MSRDEMSTAHIQCDAVRLARQINAYDQTDRDRIRRGAHAVADLFNRTTRYTYDITAGAFTTIEPQPRDYTAPSVELWQSPNARWSIQTPGAGRRTHTINCNATGAAYSASYRPYIGVVFDNPYAIPKYVQDAANRVILDPLREAMR